MRKTMQRTAAVMAGCLIIAAGASLAVAPAASAADSSSCNISAAEGFYGTWEATVNNLNLRSGPGTNYSSKGQISKGTKFKLICTSVRSQTWMYGTVETGVHAYTNGWLSAGYIGCIGGTSTCGLHQ